VGADSAMLRAHGLLTAEVSCSAVHDVAGGSTVFTSLEEGLGELVMLGALAVRRLLRVGLVMLLVVLRIPLLVVRGQELRNRCVHLAAGVRSNNVLTDEFSIG